MFLLAIGMSSLKKHLLRSSAYFLNRLFFFGILVYMSCFYIFNIKPITIISFANAYSHSVGGLEVL